MNDHRRLQDFLLGVTVANLAWAAFFVLFNVRLPGH